MKPTEPKPRGRSRKSAPKPTAPQNPDEQPATRGYVKCIARKIVPTRDHTHKLPLPEIPDFYGPASLMLVIASLVGMVISIITGMWWLMSSSVTTCVISFVYLWAGVAAWRSQQDAPVSTFGASRFISPPEIERWKPPETEKEC